MPVSKKEQTGGDLLVHRESFQYNLVFGTITNNLGATVSINQVAGYPVKMISAGSWELIAQGAVDEANIGGLIVYGPIIKDLADAGVTPVSALYAILDRGPAVVNQDVVPDDDYAGTPWNDKAAMLALLTDIKYVSLASPREVQTT